MPTRVVSLSPSFAQLRKGLREAGSAAVARLFQAERIAAERLHYEVLQQVVPVDTGALKRSGRVEGNEVVYAPADYVDPNGRHPYRYGHITDANMGWFTVAAESDGRRILEQEAQFAAADVMGGIRTGRTVSLKPSTFTP